LCFDVTDGVLPIQTMMDDLAVKRKCKRKRAIAYLKNVTETGNDQRDKTAVECFAMSSLAG